MTRDLRVTARAIFDAGLVAADPAAAVRRSLADAPVEADRIVAVGKAALAMLGAAREALPAAPALAVTNRENAVDVPGVRTLVAGHPVPDAAGEAAAREVEAFVAEAGEGETVLVVEAPTAAFGAIQAALADAGLEAREAGLQRIPTTTTALPPADAAKVLRLLDALDDHQDIQAVTSTLEITDEALAALQD